jgi:excisionase family DNA binding protein
MSERKQILSVREFCTAYGLGRTSAYREIASGRLKVLKLGRRTLIPVDSAEGWLAALRKTEGVRR